MRPVTLSAHAPWQAASAAAQSAIAKQMLRAVRITDRPLPRADLRRAVLTPG
jgi:hypothetical protein